MGFMRVFRFIFFGIGIWLLLIGGLLFVAFTYPDVELFSSIVENNASYDINTSYYFFVFGGIFLAVSILFFVIYGIKGKAWYEARVAAKKREEELQRRYTPPSSNSSFSSSSSSYKLVRYTMESKIVYMLDDGKMHPEGVPSILRSKDGKQTAFFIKGGNKPTITLMVVKQANMTYYFDNPNISGSLYPIVSVYRTGIGSSEAVVIVSTRTVHPASDNEAVGIAVKELRDCDALGVKYEECDGPIKFAYAIEGMNSLEAAVTNIDLEMLKDGYKNKCFKIFEDKLLSLIDNDTAKEYLRSIFRTLKSK